MYLVKPLKKVNFKPQIEVEFNNDKDVLLSFGGQIGKEENSGGGILFCRKDEKYLGGLKLHYQSDWGLEIDIKGCRNYQEKNGYLKVKYNLGKIKVIKEEQEFNLNPYIYLNYNNNNKSIHLGSKYEMNKDIIINSDIGIDNDKRIILGNEINYKVFDHSLNIRNEIKLSKDNIEYSNESKINLEFDLDKLGF
jgi:hypothetical protein